MQNVSLPDAACNSRAACNSNSNIASPFICLCANGCLAPCSSLCSVQDRDGPFAGVRLKQREYEEAMCAELGLLCGAFLIARAKWNQSAGNDACIARISEVCAAYGIAILLLLSLNDCPNPHILLIETPCFSPWRYAALRHNLCRWLTAHPLRCASGAGLGGGRPH